MKEFFSVPLTQLKLSQHTCPAVVLRCIDFRFRVSDQDSVAQGLKREDFDMICVPAPAKTMITSASNMYFLTDIISRVCVELHDVQEIIVLGHWDCGGYGGSKAFASSDAEESKYTEDLLEAQRQLHRKFSKLVIRVGYSKIVGDSLRYFLLN